MYYPNVAKSDCVKIFLHPEPEWTEKPEYNFDSTEAILNGNLLTSDHFDSFSIGYLIFVTIASAITIYC